MKKAVSESLQEISESGWTMYLDLSIDSYAKSLIEFEVKGGVENKHACYGEEDEESSMASDASSGPPQALEKAHGVENEDGVKLNGVDGVQMRKPKKRRVEDDENQKELYLLEDTASSPICSLKSGLTENEAHMRNFMEASKILSDSHDQADAVNKRLELLQSMLPQTPICREAALAQAIKYITELEQRIKAFEGNDKATLNRKEPTANEQYGVLRERGLCLVPISTVWSAI